MKKYFFLLMVLFVGLTACRRIKGNHKVITKKVEVKDFSEIRLSGIGKVEVIQSQESALEMKGESNILDHIDIDNENGKLVIRTRENINLQPREPLIFYVSTSTIERLSVSGAGKLITNGKISGNNPVNISLSGAGSMEVDLHYPEVKINLSGAGSITASGETKDLNITSSGVGSVHAFKLLSENSTVNLSGVGSVDVYASVSHNLRSSGVGSIHYKGEGTVESHKSGVGSIKKEE